MDRLTSAISRSSKKKLIEDLRMLNPEILHDLNVHSILIGSKSCYLDSVFCT